VSQLLSLACGAFQIPYAIAVLQNSRLHRPGYRKRRFPLPCLRRASARRTLSTQARSSVSGIKFTIRSGGIFAAKAATRARSMNSNCHGWCASVLGFTRKQFCDLGSRCRKYFSDAVTRSASSSDLHFHQSIRLGIRRESPVTGAIVHAQFKISARIS
jgi:hypothetical protein